MRKFARICAIMAAFYTGAMLASPSQYDGITSFGDSLSDIGNTPRAPITTPGGSTWVYYLGQKLGFNITASSKGGTDYAFAGALSGPLPYTITTQVPTLITQINNYLASVNGHADSRTIYTIAAGANDFSNAGGYFANGNIINPFTGTMTSNQSLITPLGLGLVNQSTNNIVNAARLIHQAGAKYIIVGNLPNVVNTPTGTGETAFLLAILNQARINYNKINTNHPVPLLTAAEIAGIKNISSTYNTELLAKLNNSGLNVIQLDNFNLLNALQQNYQLFNFTGPMSQYNPSDPSDINRVIFNSDGYHPSAETHLIDAEYALEILQGPAYASILASAPFAVFDTQNAAIQSQLSPLEQNFSNIPLCKFASFASGNYGHDNIKEKDSTMMPYHTAFRSFTVGGMYRFNQNVLTGVAVGRSMDHIHYAYHAGGFNMDENLVTLFGGYNWHHFYGNVAGNYGNIDFDNIKRQFMLGVLPETVTGRTTGYQFGVDGLVGYNIDLKTIKTGPVVSLDWQKVTVKAFSESSSHFHQTPNNGTFDALQYYRQNNQSLLGGLGWQINTQMPVNKAIVMPYLQATFEHQLKNQNRSVAAGVTTLPGSQFKMPVTAPDSNFGLISTGIQTRFDTGLMLGIGYSATVGESYKHSQNIMVNASMPI